MTEQKSEMLEFEQLKEQRQMAMRNKLIKCVELAKSQNKNEYEKIVDDILK